MKESFTQHATDCETNCWRSRSPSGRFATPMQDGVRERPDQPVLILVGWPAAIDHEQPIGLRPAECPEDIRRSFHCDVRSKLSSLGHVRSNGLIGGSSAANDMVDVGSSPVNALGAGGQSADL